MDLAKFAKMPAETGGAYLKFTPSDNVKIVRFCYNRPEDIECRRKLYDPTSKKVIWDSPEGKWVTNLSVAVYKSKSEFELMKWERSAAFARDTLLPLFEAAGGKIIDTVYKVTCSKASTLDATYSFFPLKDSENYAMPDISSSASSDESSAQDQDAVSEAAEDEDLPFSKTPASKPVQKEVVKDTAPAATVAPKRKRNFWEE